MNSNNKITIYGGGKEIGGSAILIKNIPEEKSILMDFGYNFHVSNNFLDEYLQPRDHRKILDHISLGLLPIPKGDLKGIYRKDLYMHYKEELVQRFGSELEDAPNISIILLSHAHLDHSGQIEFLSPEIKIGLGEGTKRYLEFFTDYTSNDQLLTFKPLFQRNESGKRKYKDFEKRTRAIQIIGREWKQIESTPFRIKFIPTDHSVWGTGAWLIEDIKSNIKFVYTGDIRFHGPLQNQIENFKLELKNWKPDVLITEATWFNNLQISEDVLTESQFVARVKELMRKADEEKELIIFECNYKDISRIISYAIIAKEFNRHCVISAKSYLLMKKFIEGEYSDDGIRDLKEIINEIKVLLPRKGWGIYEPEDYSYNGDIIAAFETTDAIDPKAAKYTRMNINDTKIVKSEMISKQPEKYITWTDYYQYFELLDINRQSAYLILSEAQRFDEESEGKADKKEQWYNSALKLNPKRIKRWHVSGHAYRNDLIDFILELNPRWVIPIHTENPEQVKRELSLHKSDIEVIIAKNDDEILIPPDISKTEKISKKISKKSSKKLI